MMRQGEKRRGRRFYDVWNGDVLLRSVHIALTRWCCRTTLHDNFDESIRDRRWLTRCGRGC